MQGGAWILLPTAVFAAATVLAAVLLFSRPMFRLSYVRGPAKGEGMVEAIWMGLHIPVVRWEDGGGFRRTGRWRPGRFVRRRDAAVRLLRDAECTEFRWKTDIGLEDAALTAVAAADSFGGWSGRTSESGPFTGRQSSPRSCPSRFESGCTALRSRCCEPWQDLFFRLPARRRRPTAENSIRPVRGKLT